MGLPLRRTIEMQRKNRHADEDRLHPIDRLRLRATVTLLTFGTWSRLGQDLAFSSAPMIDPTLGRSLEVFQSEIWARLPCACVRPQFECRPG